MSGAYLAEVRGRLLALAVADIDAIKADAVGKELVPGQLVPRSSSRAAPPPALVDIWRGQIPVGQVHRRRSWLLEASEAQLPPGMVTYFRSPLPHQKWVLMVRVVDDRSLLMPEALTTAVENLFSVAGILRARSLALPGLGLASKYAVPQQVAWLTLPVAIRCLAAAPSVERFGIVLEDEAVVETYVRVLKSVLREGRWIS